jgi:hypothetical protein
MGYQGYQGLGFTAQGEWNYATVYNTNDVVSYNGSSYVALANNDGEQPDVTGFWNLIASKGDQGNQGTQGYQGNQGFQGNQGYQGDRGFQGYQGSQGNDGTQGSQGNIGDPGIYESNDGVPPMDHNILWLDETATASPPNATELQGYPVSATAPTEGQVLVFTSGVWTPTTL